MHTLIHLVLPDPFFGVFLPYRHNAIVPYSLLPKAHTLFWPFFLPNNIVMYFCCLVPPHVHADIYAASP